MSSNSTAHVAVLVESPHFFKGKKVVKLPPSQSLQILRSTLFSSLQISGCTEEDFLLEIHDAQWNEYVHLEVLEEVLGKSRLRVSSFPRGGVFSFLLSDSDCIFCGQRWQNKRTTLHMHQLRRRRRKRKRKRQRLRLNHMSIQRLALSLSSTMTSATMRAMRIVIN